MYAARYRRKVGGAAADTEKTDPCIDAARRAVESVGEDCGGAAGRRREQDGGDRESGLRNDPDRHGIRLPARRSRCIIARFAGPRKRIRYFLLIPAAADLKSVV